MIIGSGAASKDRVFFEMAEKIQFVPKNRFLEPAHFRNHSSK
jgi:hypothetical protein